MQLQKSFWLGKRVLLTGHTGFKGSWLALWLNKLGAKVTGIALPPATHPNLFSLAGVPEGIDSHFHDIRDAEGLAKLVDATSPDIVLHLAAQALVRTGYRQPLETFAVNVMGTVNLLDALRRLDSVRVALLVTTDKVYQNREWIYPYRENDTLGGHDPYSASKAASEIVAASFRDAFLIDRGVAVATARAGNVIGGGDWSLDRLIPDAMRAWSAGEPLEIRRPQAIRPWQHVLEPLAGYLRLAEQLWDKPYLAGAYNFGPEVSKVATVREVIEIANKCFGSGQVVWGDGTEGPHEAALLALDTAKARTVLGVVPQLTMVEAIEHTIHWYKRLGEGADARTLCLTEIAEFEALP